MDDSTFSKDILDEAESYRSRIGAEDFDELTHIIYDEAEKIAHKAVISTGKGRKFDLNLILDKYIVHPFWGFPIMFILFALMFWITIIGANYPSGLLFTVLVDWTVPVLKSGAEFIHMPWWLSGFLIDGMYLATAWVVSVMLPPMAIFFPMFTLLEDLGYLPRVAFNLDSIFKRVGGHGKQAMTMMMGFGCNAAGVIATRIIDSPRERLVAIITNNFALCNGRWPTQILIATLFIGSLAPPYLAGMVSALSVVGIALAGVGFTFLVSWALSRTVLKGEASTFSLELPPYRPPKILQTLYTSLINRTIFVLWRAVVFALPAGAVIWLVSNITITDVSLAEYFIDWVDPFAMIIGLNGVILLAYIVAIPANEIVIPTILMLTVLVTGTAGMGEGAGVMFEIESQAELRGIFEAGGWTLLTAINLMVFSLLHNPCSTTIFTIYKETKSVKWTVISTFLPIVMGILATFLITIIWRSMS